MATERQIERAAEELGELLASHEEAGDLERFAEYEDRPVQFVEEVLGEDPWDAQRKALELLNARDQLAWRSAQAIGKSRTIAYAALWWAYARRGRALISAPTRRSAEEVIMRTELARIFYRNPDLPGDLYTSSLRIRREEPAILAFTAASASAATGQHDPEGGILAILDEAQGCPPEMWTAMDANTTGEKAKQFVCGNPLEPTGPFFEVSRPESGWTTMQTSALDHPNLREEGRHIPGGPSTEWLERMEKRWGRGEPMWVARVEGQFPADAVEGLFARRLVDAAIERDLPDPENAEPVVAVDPARHGMDRTAVAVRRGRIVEELTTWSGASTTETEKKVEAIAREAGVRPRYSDAPFELKKKLRDKGKEVPWGTVVVDEIGIGAGVVDGLEDAEWPCRGWKGSRKAQDSDQFANLRAEAFWRLRQLLEDGRVSLPDDRKLREELLSVKWSPNSRGQVQIEDKSDLKSRLGRSPDRLDAVTMAFHPKATSSGGMTAEEMISHW